MGQANADTLPPEVEAVRQRIEEWRQTRAKRTRMPEDLWSAAAELAREHGVWRIARALRVRYDSLRSRLAEGEAGGERRPEPAVRSSFVDLGPVLGNTRTDSGATTVELSRPDGARLSLRFASGGDIDLQSLISAFCQPGR